MVIEQYLVTMKRNRNVWVYDKFELVHKHIYIYLNMVIWGDIYKDALILDELCMHIKHHSIVN